MLTYSQKNYSIESEGKNVKLFSETWRGKKFIGEHDFVVIIEEKHIKTVFAYMVNNFTPGKLLQFPTISNISDLFAKIEPHQQGKEYYCFINNPFRAFSVAPTPILQKYLSERMFPEYHVHFEIFDHGETYLIIFSYSEIIASHWLAEVKKESLPGEGENK